MDKYLSKQSVDFALANLKQLVFEVTDACNLNCKYCGYGEFYDDYDNREDKMLPVEKAFKIIDYLAAYWNSDMNTSFHTNVFISFYGGEPLLNMPFIKKVVEYIKNLDCPYRTFSFSMTTNALLLDKYMDYLNENNFFLLISLDGDKENTGYRVDKAGNNAYDRIVKNVDLLKEKYPEYFENRINFNAVLHNKNSVEEIHRFFKQKYNKIPSIGELNNMGIRADKKGEFIETYRNSRESLYQSEHYEDIEKELFMNSGTYQSAIIFLHQYSGFVYKDYTDLLFDKSKKENKQITGTCLPFSKKMYITVNGKILPCERIGHQHALGEINDNEIILNNEAIAEKYNAYYSKMEKQCEKCHNKKACTQCIFNLDIENKPICRGFMNDELFKRYIDSQMAFFEKNPEAYFKLMNDVVVN